MSDWKSRAKPVSDWKSRARVITPEEEAQRGGAEVDSPFARALASSKESVVTVETPDGPVRLTRGGQRVGTAEEVLGPAEARFKEDALKAVLSMASGGGPLLDEGYGALKALDTIGTDKPFMGAYQQGRGEARREVARATRDVSPTVSAFGAEVPVLPVGGALAVGAAGGGAPSALGRIGSAAYQGGAQALGLSEADLTEGDVGGVAKDVGAGAALGGIAGAAGEALAAPFRWLSGRLGGEAAAARQATQDAIQATKDKAVASAVGSVGRVTATQGNAAETLLEVLRAPHLFDDAVVKEAQALVASPEGKLLLSRAAANNLDKLRQSLSAETAARGTLHQATQAAAPAAVAAETAAKVAPEALRSDLGGRLWRSVGQRALLGVVGGAVGRGVDALTGGEGRGGTALGAALGAATAPGALQMVRNVGRSPAFQTGANALMQRLTQGAADVVPGAARQAAIAGQAAGGAASLGRQLSEEEAAAVDAFASGGI